MFLDSAVTGMKWGKRLPVWNPRFKNPVMTADVGLDETRRSTLGILRRDLQIVQTKSS